MYFFRGKAPNFGDELNHWLLPKVFPNFFDDDVSTLFLGIGSILFDSHPKMSRKIVFGSGYGGYTAKPEIDDKWKFYCVRGPRTAAAFHLGQDKVAGDSAILISKYFKRRLAKPNGYAFMPHYQSLERGNWPLVCKIAGIRFIDPREPIDDVLAAMDQSEVLITEAMHGAIVADAIRLPWIPVLPLDQTHHMKWFDWAEALDLKFRREILLPSSFGEAKRALSQTSACQPFLRRRHMSAAKGSSSPDGAIAAVVDPDTGTNGSAPSMLDQIFIRAATASLKRAMKQAPNLSSDLALNRVVEKLETQSDRIKQDFVGA